MGLKAHEYLFATSSALAAGSQRRIRRPQSAPFILSVDRRPLAPIQVESLPGAKSNGDLLLGCTTYAMNIGNAKPVPAKTPLGGACAFPRGVYDGNSDPDWIENAATLGRRRGGCGAEAASIPRISLSSALACPIVAAAESFRLPDSTGAACCPVSGSRRRWPCSRVWRAPASVYPSA